VGLDPQMSQIRAEVERTHLRGYLSLCIPL